MSEPKRERPRWKQPQPPIGMPAWPPILTAKWAAVFCGYSSTSHLTRAENMGLIAHHGRRGDLPNAKTTYRLEDLVRLMKSPQADIRRRIGYHGDGWIYFVEAVGAERIKIGWARVVAKRIRHLQPGCPFPLALLGAIPARWEEEAKLHEHFDQIHACGEWFHATPELRTYIDQNRLDAGPG